MYLRNDNIFTIGEAQDNLSYIGCRIAFPMVKTVVDFTVVRILASDEVCVVISS